MFGDKSLDHLNEDLKKVDAAIDAHVFNSERVKKAQTIVDASDHEDREKISRELADNDLPSLVELGSITLKNMTSWARLHRDKKKILTRMQKLSSP